MIKLPASRTPYCWKDTFGKTELCEISLTPSEKLDPDANPLFAVTALDRALLSGFLYDAQHRLAYNHSEESQLVGTGDAAPATREMSGNLVWLCHDGGASAPTLYGLGAGNQLLQFPEPVKDATSGQMTRATGTPVHYTIPMDGAPYVVDCAIAPWRDGGNKLQTMVAITRNHWSQNGHSEDYTTLIVTTLEAIHHSDFANTRGLMPSVKFDYPLGWVAIAPDAASVWVTPITTYHFGNGEKCKNAYRVHVEGNKLVVKTFTVKSGIVCGRVAFQCDDQNKLWAAVPVDTGLALLAAHANPSSEIKYIDAKDMYGDDSWTMPGSHNTVWTLRNADFNQHEDPRRTLWQRLTQWDLGTGTVKCNGLLPPGKAPCKSDSDKDRWYRDFGVAP
ncbi:hypothetical protein [Streptomyces sp. NPDC087310]|uniref:hypothetical protein n=1 Tax=Streptomyces sp. NPDC087310 TaxID=3365783 RepID=UPI0037FECEBF